MAQSLIRGGHLRCNGNRVCHCSTEIAVGDILTIPQGMDVRAVRILALPDRRKPAREAQSCYCNLDPGG